MSVREIVTFFDDLIQANVQKGRSDQRPWISYLNNNQTNNTEKNALPVFSLLISLLEPLEAAAVKPIIALDSLLCFALPACQLSFNTCLWLLYMDQSYPLLWSRWKIALAVLPACEHSNNHQGNLRLNIPFSWQIQLVVHSPLLTIVVAFECICCVHTNSRQEGGEVTQCVGESKHNACEQWWSPCNRHQVASLPAPFALQPFVNPDLHTHQNLATQITTKTPSCDLDFGAFHSPPVFMCLCLLLRCYMKGGPGDDDVYYRALRSSGYTGCITELSCWDFDNVENWDSVVMDRVCLWIMCVLANMRVRVSC